jgi:hypothetical protein
MKGTTVKKNEGHLEDMSCLTRATTDFIIALCSLHFAQTFGTARAGFLL